MMANSILTEQKARPIPHAQQLPAGPGSPEPIFRFVLTRLASLRITVALFAMAIFLVIVGTLAQVEKDVWQVVEEYFRTPLTWVDLRLFFPPSFFPGLSVPYDVALPGGLLIPLGFYFPGGWLIGGLMAVNLLAAHAARFTIQARGTRLALGTGILAVGVVLAWAVVALGSSSGFAAPNTLPIAWAWRTIQTALGIAALASLYGAFRKPARSTPRRAAMLVVAVVLAALVVWPLSRGRSIPLGESSVRILWQLCKGELAALVLLLGCILLFQKRAGIVLLHGGIGLLMLGEVLTGLTAVEGHMQMGEGETTNYVRHSRELELAIVDHCDPERDNVVVVPESRLLTGTKLQDPDLPFDLRLIQFFKNSAIRPVQEKDFNPATAGLGLKWLADPSRPVSGTDADKANMPTAYVTLLRKGGNEQLGTYLVGLALTQSGLTQSVDVDGKAYEVSLRQKRMYRPYSITLLDVTKEDYPGTDIPKHYASLVRLTDESRHVERTVKIWMNNPLRFAGETFYQSGYYRDPETRIEASTLAVVSNTGWMIPYVGCMLVGTGLLAHFSVVLLRFLNRRTFKVSGDETQSRARPHLLATCTARNASVLGQLILSIIILVSGVWLIGKCLPELPDGEFQLNEFGKLPVVDQGRAKPVDSLARNALQFLSGRQSFLDLQGKEQSAIRWLLDVITRPETAAQYKVFRIENPEVLTALGLEPRKGWRYAFQEFVEHLGDFKKQVDRAAALEPSELSTYQKKVLELQRKLGVWHLLIQAYIPPQELVKLPQLAAPLGPLPARQSVPLSIPGEPGEENWQTYVGARTRYLAANHRAGSLPGRATQLLNMALKAYSAGEVEAFNKGVNSLRNELRTVSSPNLSLHKVPFEAFYNQLDPCYDAAALYLVAFLFASLSWLGFRVPLNRASVVMAALGWAVHTVALGSRIYISGRPPVTNLYSSAIFIGWAAVVLGLALEAVYRKGAGNVVSAVIGFVTLVIAHYLAKDGDTFAVLQAVLDTQFWLATHVVCITLGYTATYVAGLLGVIYLLRGVLTRSLTSEAGKELSRMIYGTLCFAILFSFVGTVLGGLWADDSWGRFWGWDPKENGALIIVLWNALVLHARWAGLVRQRGLAILAVGGNIAVSWSWFGVNELGIGLHSYGFTEGVLRTLGMFVVSQLAIIAMGLVPESRWRSRRSAQTEACLMPS